MEVTFKSFIDLVKSYNAEEVERVTKAYEYAALKHQGQYRQSGEAYITHPLNVAYILAQMHADGDTLCAGLLHDVLEDTNSTKEELTELFNSEVAKLVDGVTNLSKVEFSSPEAVMMANTRKIITGITEDVRIIIIKLADRLHNMRTLKFKRAAKQKEKALETLEIFVPIAYNIGAYHIKHELEDLSLKYLKPDVFKALSETQEQLVEDSRGILSEMLFKIKEILKDNNIPGFLKERVQNVYGIYKRLSNVYGDISLNEILKLKPQDLSALRFHDLLALKVMVETVDECYMMLGKIHAMYHPVNEKFKDYICNPKTNMYQSLHTTVHAPDERLVQMQIRTIEMDKTAYGGITTYWDIHKGQARIIMQDKLRRKYQFFNSIEDINYCARDDKEFIKQIKEELFQGEIYVVTADGEVKALPIGSCPIDFAYKVHTEVGHHMVGALVNDEMVALDYELKNQDHVKIITDDNSPGPDIAWLDIAKSNYARRKIREFHRK